MLTYHLKFDSEEQASVVLFNEDVPVYPNTDVIGEIVKIVDDSDPEEIVTETLPGWHVNVYSDKELPELEQYKINVKKPIRVIA